MILINFSAPLRICFRILDFRISGDIYWASLWVCLTNENRSERDMIESTRSKALTHEERLFERALGMTIALASRDYWNIVGARKTVDEDAEVLEAIDRMAERQRMYDAMSAEEIEKRFGLPPVEPDFYQIDPNATASASEIRRWFEDQNFSNPAQFDE